MFRTGGTRPDSESAALLDLDVHRIHPRKSSFIDSGIAEWFFASMSEKRARASGIISVLARFLVSVMRQPCCRKIIRRSSGTDPSGATHRDLLHFKAHILVLLTLRETFRRVHPDWL